MAIEYSSSLPTSVLLAVVKDLARHAGRKPLPALWRCDSTGITIEWGGVNERIEVDGTGEVTVRVSGTTMKGLPKAPWRESSLDLVVDDDYLQLGRRRLSCTRVTVDVASFLLPLGPSDAEFLRLHFREPPEVIEQAGLASQVDDRIQRATQTIDKFVDRLLWTGLDGDRLRTLVWNEIAGASASDQETKVPVNLPQDPVTGPQLDLLGNTDLPLFVNKKHDPGQ